jgi:hypothetical protein
VESFSSAWHCNSVLSQRVSGIGNDDNACYRPDLPNRSSVRVSAFLLFCSGIPALFPFCWCQRDLAQLLTSWVNRTPQTIWRGLRYPALQTEGVRLRRL